jgi:pimeloyl-ACP methyl ester carboxylesterase
MNKNNLLINLLQRKSNQRKNSQLLQISTPNSITEYGYVKIGGIEQWITIRGEDRSNPILLFIHGGPASTYSIFSHCLRAWEKHFTIVQWDQRGAGKTFSKNGKSGSGKLSFDRLAQDGIELVEYLCRRLQHQKVILLASSAGSLTGIMMAKQRPDLFYAYVGTDQNVPDPQHLSYQLVLDALSTTGNTRGVRLLEKLGPVRNNWKRQDFTRMNQFIVKATRDVPNMISDLILPAMLASPDHSIKDIIDIFRGMTFSLECLFDELVDFNFEKIGNRFELPFFVFQGDSDILTPTATAKTWFDEIETPHKDFVLIRQAGHLACFAQTDQFLEELLKRVRPLALSPERLLRL